LQGNVADIRASHATETYLLKTRKEVAVSGFNLLEQKNLNGIFEYRIKKNAGDTNNSLLEKLMAQTEILSFEEILPSMNDIFIKTVSQSNKLI